VTKGLMPAAKVIEADGREPQSPETLKETPTQAALNRSCGCLKHLNFPGANEKPLSYPGTPRVNDRLYLFTGARNFFGQKHREPLSHGRFPERIKMQSASRGSNDSTLKEHISVAEMARR